MHMGLYLQDVHSVQLNCKVTTREIHGCSQCIQCSNSLFLLVVDQAGNYGQMDNPSKLATPIDFSCACESPDLVEKDSREGLPIGIEYTTSDS
jgi:hypothetical protein